MTSNNKQLTVWQAQPIEIFGGMQIPGDMPEEQFTAIIQTVQRYTGKFENVDDYIGVELGVAGMVVHEAEVTNKNHWVDPDTGIEPDMIVKLRTVLKVVSFDGKQREEPVYIGFVSSKVAREAQTIWIPRYGPGDWAIVRRFKVRQLATSSGRRTYSLELVG